MVQSKWHLNADMIFFHFILHKGVMSEYIGVNYNLFHIIDRDFVRNKTIIVAFKCNVESK